MRRLIHFLLLTTLSYLLCWQPAVLAGNIDITYARVESSTDGYRFVGSFNFELSRELENLLTNGIPLYFVTEVNITRPRWYWLDENTMSNKRSVRISYNLITRQYRASINGSFSQNFKELNDALALVRYPSRWVVAEKAQLDNDKTYHVAVRIYLDTDQLPKPFQFNALNNSDWQLSSEWKRITFKAGDK